MNIELKNLRTYPRLSDETNAFNADVWIDGKKAGTAENDGKGGANLLYFADFKLLHAFEKWAKAQPPVDGLKMDADFYISLLVDRMEQDKQFARWCKTKTCFRLKGDEQDAWRTINRPYSASLKKLLAEKHGDQIEEILNDRFGGMMGDNAAETLRLKKLCKGKTVIHFKEDPAGEFRTVAKPFTAELKGRLVVKYPQIDEFVNERFA